MNTRTTSDIRDHFSRRASEYETFGTWVNDEAILFAIMDCIPKLSPQILNVVDLGAGTGAVARYILKKYPFSKSVTAVDICPEMLSKILEPEIKKYVTSLENMPFENDIFDVAISRQCLHYVENLEQAIKEIRRIIKNNGVFILSQIVPLESTMKDYWYKITKFRQPLRQNYYSEDDWIASFKYEGFFPVSIERFSHRGSVLKWANKYDISDLALINEHKKLLLNAPKQFIEEYNVVKNGEDVNYDSFWFVAKFRLDIW